MRLVILYASLHVLLHCLAGEGGARHTIHIGCGSLAYFHAIPFFEQSRLHLVEEVRCLLVGEWLNLHHLITFNIDVERCVATKSSHVLGKGGGVDHICAVGLLGHCLIVIALCNHCACCHRHHQGDGEHECFILHCFSFLPFYLLPLKIGAKLLNISENSKAMSAISSFFKLKSLFLGMDKVEKNMWIVLAYTFID